MLQKLKTFSIAIAVISATAFHAQTISVPAKSPLQTIKQAFALSDITIEYSRPGAKNRVVYGDVVPFGKIWRTGANGSTKITFGEDVKVEGIAVTAGTYAIYTIPNKDSWEIMFYKDLKLGGNVANYNKENEVIHFTVKPKSTNDKTETFTIDLASITATSVNVDFIWEQTRVGFSVVSEIDTKIMANISTTMAKDARPFYQAASYFYDTNKDLIKALDWVNKAIDQNPDAYWVVLLKAKIQAKSNDKKGALATADKVIMLAKADKNDDYVKMAEKFIEENKK